MLLGDLGASVVRLTDREAPIDRDLTWTRAWRRNKVVIELGAAAAGATAGAALGEAVHEHLADADVVFLYGPHAEIEQRGLGVEELRAAFPRLVVVRCEPSVIAGGVLDDALLVEAASGFCTQLAGHRDGPIFVDVRAAASGAASLLATSALALLYERELTGRGGAASSSLYDGMLSTLGCMIGRSAGAPADVEGYWRDGSTFPNFLYRCGDGELVQVWFGGKGMYPKLLEVLGDEPSEQGYYADQISGQLGVRAKRWTELFLARTRDEWIDRLRAEGVACEPVNRPGDALSDPHLDAVGLIDRRGEATFLGGVVDVDRLPSSIAAPAGAPRPLEGLRVADFSAFVAGPLAAQVLADLGAEVVKIEPPAGEAMRAAAYAVAACQRGKRSVALDIASPEAEPAVRALLCWADVVLHNFRVGVAERIGIGAETVGELRPDAVYCHASGFGAGGPRAKLPANDALMQALTGFEVANGGDGNDPIAGTWIPIDMAGGWLAAIGALAGLYARARFGVGTLVNTSLLGAGLLLHGGVYRSGGEVVAGPSLDGEQTGYGPGYRIYRTCDDAWIAVVIPDAHAWAKLRSLLIDNGLGDMPEEYRPLRRGADDGVAQAAERVIGAAIATRSSDDWVGALRGLGVRVQPVVESTRDGFRSAILDDVANDALGRVARYATPSWGDFEQIGPLLRLSGHRRGPTLRIPEVGEHSVAVLSEVGVDRDTIARLVESGVLVQRAVTESKEGDRAGSSRI